MLKKAFSSCQGLVCNYAEVTSKYQDKFSVVFEQWSQMNEAERCKSNVMANLCKRLADGQSPDKIKADLRSVRRDCKGEIAVMIKFLINNRSIIGDGADGDDWESMLENIQNNNLELPEDIDEIIPVPDTP